MRQALGSTLGGTGSTLHGGSARWSSNTTGAPTAASRPRRRSSNPVNSLPDWSHAASNVAAGGPVPANLMHFIQPDAIQSGLHQHLTPDAVSQIITSIQDVIYGHAASGAHADVDTLTAASALADLDGHAMLSASTAVQEFLPQAAAVSLSVSQLQQFISAAQPAIPELAANLTSAGLLAAMADWSMDKLAYVQVLHPEAYTTLSSSIVELTKAVELTVATEATHATQQLGAGLVVGLQEMLAALRMESTGSGAVQAMTAMQHTVAAAIATEGAAVEGGMKVTLAVMALIMASMPRGGEHSSTQPDGYDGTLPARYDPDAISAYFNQRPMMVMQRNAIVVSKLTSFAVKVLADWRSGQFEANMPQRAKELRGIVESLGPAYIKIAQLLSTRGDLVPPAYLHEFSVLQDSVPTFSTAQARVLLEEGLGRPVDQVFSSLSREPLASASLGQVYKGRLRPEVGGAEVAVKVQRPNVFEGAALDIFVMRRAALIFSKLPMMNDQWARVLDDWASSFWLEMDYTLEASHAMAFQAHMEQAGLAAITTAQVYPELTSQRILVTGWVEGEKLTESKAKDVRQLCSTLLNCYLIQLLETGLLHADPHPGNLMRTPDGRICVLDFGLVSEVTEEQRVGLVEFIAYLTMEDWDSVARSLVTLGFLPEGLPDPDKFDIRPLLKDMLGGMLSGGGLATGLDFSSISGQLEVVAFEYKLVVPPWFANIIRAFGIIEGIALNMDPNYAIVHECLPYLSRRLLTDSNPRMRAALRHLLYGGRKRIDVERLQRLLSAIGAFNTSPDGPDGSRAAGPTFAAAMQQERPKGRPLRGLLSGDDQPVLSAPIIETLKVVFSPDGSYAQELLVDEMAAAVDAMSKEALGETVRLVAGSASVLGPLPGMALPMAPLQLLSSVSPAVALSEEDQEMLGTVRYLLDVLTTARTGVGLTEMAEGGGRAVRVARDLMPHLPQLLPGLQATMAMFSARLMQRWMLRFAEALEPQAVAQQLHGQQQQLWATLAGQQQQQQPYGGHYGGGHYGGQQPQHYGGQPQQQYGAQQQWGQQQYRPSPGYMPGQQQQQQQYGAPGYGSSSGGSSSRAGGSGSKGAGDKGLEGDWGKKAAKK